VPLNDAILTAFSYMLQFNAAIAARSTRSNRQQTRMASGGFTLEPGAQASKIRARPPIFRSRARWERKGRESPGGDCTLGKAPKFAGLESPLRTAPCKRAIVRQPATTPIVPHVASGVAISLFGGHRRHCLSDIINFKLSGASTKPNSTTFSLSLPTVEACKRSPRRIWSYMSTSCWIRRSKPRTHQAICRLLLVILPISEATQTAQVR
jgi:hypothetical protein